MSDSEPDLPRLVSSSSSHGESTGQHSRSVTSDSGASADVLVISSAEAPCPLARSFACQPPVGTSPAQGPGDAAGGGAILKDSYDDGLGWLKLAQPATILASLAVPSPDRSRPISTAASDRTSSDARSDCLVATAQAVGGGGERALGSQDPAIPRPPVPGRRVSDEAPPSAEADSSAEKRSRGRKQAQRPQRSHRRQGKR